MGSELEEPPGDCQKIRCAATGQRDGRCCSPASNGPYPAQFPAHASYQLPRGHPVLARRAVRALAPDDRLPPRRIPLSEKRARISCSRDRKRGARTSPGHRRSRTHPHRAAHRSVRPPAWPSPFPNWNIASRATVPPSRGAAGVLLRPDGSRSHGTTDATSAERSPSAPGSTARPRLPARIPHPQTRDVTPRDHTALAHVLFRELIQASPASN